MRSGQHRQPQRRGLEQIVPADRHQAAADEGDIGRCVKQRRVLPPYRPATPCRSPMAPRRTHATRLRRAKLTPRRASNSATAAKAICVPRHQQQQCVGHLGSAAAHAHRAAVLLHPRACCRRSRPAARCQTRRAAPDPARTIAAAEFEVEFHIADDVSPVRRRHRSIGSARHPRRIARRPADWR